jgi:hypothetical protein
MTRPAAAAAAVCQARFPRPPEMFGQFSQRHHMGANGSHRALGLQGEKDAKLARKLGQLQSFIAVFLQECMGKLAPSGPT